MPSENAQPASQIPKPASHVAEAALPLRKRLAAWALHMWRPVGTAVVIGLALLTTWHVIYGKHGLSVWQQKRAEDRQLQQQIEQLQQENTQMQRQINRLQSDPDAIEREARERLHYAKPGEVIYTLPDVPQQPK